MDSAPPARPEYKARSPQWRPITSITTALPWELENKFVEGDIIVAKFTDSDITEFIEKASAIVTETGGLTSHTAVAAVHFGIPAVVGATNAQSLIKDGQIVTVDPIGGVIYNGETKVI